MEPHEREMLARTLELSEQNNKLLRKMERIARYQAIFKAVYWVIVIGAAVGLFYFTQPYIEDARDAYGGIRNAISQFTGSLGPTSTPR